MQYKFSLCLTQQLDAGGELTALNGEDGEIMNRVGFSVQRLGGADDPAQCVHIKETLQVCVPVNGVPGEKYTSTIIIDTLKNTFTSIDLTLKYRRFFSWKGKIMNMSFSINLRCSEILSFIQTLINCVYASSDMEYIFQLFSKQNRH